MVYPLTLKGKYHPDITSLISPRSCHRPPIIGLVGKSRVLYQSVSIQVKLYLGLHHRLADQPEYDSQVEQRQDTERNIGQFYLADGPHILQVLTVLSEMEVPVDLQDKLQVQVLPVCRVVDEVGIHPLPRLVI